MSKSARILCAVLGGQLAQIFISIVAKTLYIEKTILWSSAVGFMFIFILFVGVLIGGGDISRTKKH